MRGQMMKTEIRFGMHTDTSRKKGKSEPRISQKSHISSPSSELFE